MISEAEKSTEELPSLAELRALADSARDNETKAQALCLAAGVAAKMGLRVLARKLMRRSCVVASCGGVTLPTRKRIAECSARLNRRPVRIASSPTRATDGGASTASSAPAVVPPPEPAQ